MLRGLWLAIGGGLAIALAIGALVLRPESRAEARHRELCMKTRNAILKDWIELAGDNVEHRQRATARFFSSREMHQNDESIEMRLDDGAVSRMDLACLLDRDVACRAKLARDLYDKLERAFGN